MSPDPAPGDGVFVDRSATARFLTQATFGPTPTDLATLTGGSASAWFRDQLDLPQTTHRALIGEPQVRGGSTMFWRTALQAEDQLRQRMVYALSQILVVSESGVDGLSQVPQAMGYFQDVLSEHAFGTYRELLEAVTYTPAMGFYLTYRGNRPGDATTGRVPDENYARELLQLFTVGVVRLNPDGTPTLDADGQSIELFDNTDITGLARVFTGLDLLADPDGRDLLRNGNWDRPMVLDERSHSSAEKRFLDTTIPAGTDGAASIAQALDGIVAHPNAPPFIARQLIQRFVTSHPQPDYVERVAAAFTRGTFELPDGSSVGSGRRGDLAATLAGVLFDAAARQEGATTEETFGKLREPALRVTAWARAFEVSNPAAEYVEPLQFADLNTVLAQKPFSAPSVFNFYRPGYVAPGTESGARALTTPELQLLNASSSFGYINAMTFLVNREQLDPSYQDRVRAQFENAASSPRYSAAEAATAFVADYEPLLPLAADAKALVDAIDELLTYSRMTAATRSLAQSLIETLPANAAVERVQMAVLVTVTSVDFLIQR